MGNIEAKGPSMVLIHEVPNIGSPAAGKLALSGYMEGPFIETDPATMRKDYFYRLHTSPGSTEYLTVNWRDIRWIDGYPQSGADMVGSEPRQLGRRIIWVDDGPALQGRFLGGEIVERYRPLEDTTSIEARWKVYAMGRKGPSSTSPPCICPEDDDKKPTDTKKPTT